MLATFTAVPPMDYATSVTNKRLFVDNSLRRVQILDAAKRLFAQRGYHATTMRDIAAALDLQGGSLYAHIASKADLLWEIVGRAAADCTGFAAVISEQEPDPRRRLRRLVEAHIAYMTDDIEKAAVFHHEWQQLPLPRRERIAAQRREYEAHYHRTINDGIAMGAFAPVDSWATTMLILSAGNWLYQWYRADGRLDPPMIAAHFNTLIERVLQPAAPVEPLEAG